MDEPIHDAEQYHSKEAYGYKDIVLMQVKRITVIGSQELREGWWKYTAGTGGREFKTAYISDGREAYIEAVKILNDLLLPKFDEEMTKASRMIKQEVKELYAVAKKEEWSRTQYLNDKQNVYRRLFQRLCLFLERKLKWFEVGVLDD